jgi:hypothetical protein
MERYEMHDTTTDVPLQMSPELCEEDKLESGSAADENSLNSLPEMRSLSERSTSTEWSSTLVREGSDRWNLDDDNSSQSEIPSDENEHHHKMLQPKEDVRPVTEEAEIDLNARDVAEIVVEESEECLQRKLLRWGTIEMRLYPIILGDHPDAWQGPPVSFLQLILICNVHFYPHLTWLLI